MQTAFNKATTSEKRPLAQTDTYRTGTIFDYTRPEFSSMLRTEAREHLLETKVDVSPAQDRPFYRWYADRIDISPTVDPLLAEHEAIHALSIGGGNVLERLKRNYDQLFWDELTGDQQKGIKQTYGVSGIVEEARWYGGKGQEAPAVLWQSVRGNPRAVSLYSAALPFFQKYFRPELFE